MKIKPDDGSRKWLEKWIQHTIATCFQETFPHDSYLYESNIGRDPMDQVVSICRCYKTIYDKLQKIKDGKHE